MARRVSSGLHAWRAFASNRFTSRPQFTGRLAPRLLVFLLVVLLLLAGLLLPPGPLALAQPQVDTSRREALEAQIEEYQELLEARRREEARIEEELGATSEELRQRVAEREQVSAELTALSRQRDELQAQIAQLESDLARTSERIERIQGDLQALRGRISALLVNLHRQRTGRFARVLSQVESFHDLQVKNRHLSLLNEQDTDVVRTLDETRAELIRAQNQLSQQLQARETAEEELRVNQAQLEDAQARLVQVIAGLEETREGQLAQRQSVIAEQENLESALGNLDQQLEQEIERLRQERARLLREAQQEYLAERERERLRQEADDVGERIDNLTTPLTASSDYAPPVANASIISRYGESNNSYMAIRASTDFAAVMAVGDGVVRGVSFVSANDGYMVSVAHSDNLSTVYTNLRPPVVEVGDRVSQGDVIGYLGGSTLVAPDTLKLWVQLSEGGRTSFVDPATTLGF